MPRLGPLLILTLALPAIALGQEAHAPQLLLPDEPDWDAAEQAAAANQFDQATDGYLKVLRTTQKPYLKTRASLRLLDTAPRARRYDAAITAYLTLVQSDPAQAAAHRPTLPADDSSYTDTALQQVQRTLSTPTLTDDQRQLLLSLQLDLYRTRKDDAGAAETLKQLNQLTASPANGAARRFADTKLAEARIALDHHDPAGAAAALDAARPALTDPAAQEEALYLLAKAADARATPADPASLKDAGLAYMRVVAQFQDTPGSRHVADALAGCASVLERLGQTKIAADLYEQAAIQYDTRPEAQAARASARRLRNGNSKH